MIALINTTHLVQWHGDGSVDSSSIHNQGWYPSERTEAEEGIDPPGAKNTKRIGVQRRVTVIHCLDCLLHSFMPTAQSGSCLSVLKGH